MCVTGFVAATLYSISVQANISNPSASSFVRICFKSKDTFQEIISRPGLAAGVLLDQDLNAISSISTPELTGLTELSSLKDHSSKLIWPKTHETSRQFIERLIARYRQIPSVLEMLTKGLELLPEERIVLHNEPLGGAIWRTQPDSAACGLFPVGKQETISYSLNQGFSFYLHLDGRIINHHEFNHASGDLLLGQLNRAVVYLLEILYAYIKFKPYGGETVEEEVATCEANSPYCINMEPPAPDNVTLNRQASILVKFLIQDQERSTSEWRKIFDDIKFDPEYKRSYRPGFIVDCLRSIVTTHPSWSKDAVMQACSGDVNNCAGSLSKVYPELDPAKLSMVCDQADHYPYSAKLALCLKAFSILKPELAPAELNIFCNNKIGEVE